MRLLIEFTSGVKRKDQIEKYLSLCESTSDAKIEKTKQDLLHAMSIRVSTSENPKK